MKDPIALDWLEPSGHPRWRYRVNRDVNFHIPYELWLEDMEVVIHRLDGAVIGSITADGIMTVRRGYCFDGATCAPDLPGVLYAACGRDLLRQAVDCRHFPYSVRECDQLFDRWMRDTGFEHAAIYSAGVAVGRGWRNFREFWWARPASVTITLLDVDLDD